MFNKKEYMEKYHKKHYKEHKELYLKRSQQQRKRNPKAIAEYMSQYNIDNKQRLTAYRYRWHLDNIKKIKEYIVKRSNQIRKNGRIYQNKEYKTNLRFRLNKNIRNLINITLKGAKNGRCWESLLGYSYNELKEHLEQTIPKGYTWQNYLNGKLHVDHIIPIRAFVFDKPEDSEFKDCWSLHNLKLLPAKENLSKKAVIKNPILLWLLLNIKGG